MFRTRLSLTELETRETPSGIDPLGPDGGTEAPAGGTVQTSTPDPAPVLPPLDPN